MDLKQQAYNLLRQFVGQANTLTIPRPYITMTGSIESALLLSQIVYWSDRTTMADGWFAKSYVEWEDELSLTQYQVSKAVKVLVDFGVETKLKKFNDIPTLHYRVNTSVFLNRVMEFFDNPGDMKKLDNPLTETTRTHKKNIATSGAVEGSKSKEPKPRKANPIFDAVALGSFGLSKLEGDDKTLGARIGKIVAWLNKQADITPERVMQFYAWYRNKYENADAPRDPGKFAEWWTKFASGNAPIVNEDGEVRTAGYTIGGADDPFADEIIDN